MKTCTNEYLVKKMGKKRENITKRMIIVIVHISEKKTLQSSIATVALSEKRRRMPAHRS
jgi:hypothetical protein